ncbi:unnamed protein product [Linum tenue]|uniref:Cytochrome P450 n=1 Tax=Linum tenue TaxID=586396 RepID=A0AAV0LHP3_9ROSI|nr:unnamed protein product [Linum tenue]
MEYHSYSQTHFFPAAIFATTLLFLISSCTLLFLRRRQSNTSTATPPPGPTKLPFIGNLHQIAAGSSSLPHYLLRDLSAKHGSVMSLQLGQVPYVVISSAESAKQAMKTHDAVFAHRPAMLSARIMSYDFSGIGFAPYGAYWRHLRKIAVQELFSARRVRLFGSTREEEASDAVARIFSAAASAGQREEEVNFSEMVFSLTNGVVARVTFGKKYDGQEEFIPLIDEITKVIGGFNLADLFPAVKFLPVVTGMRSNLLKLRSKASRLLEAIIDDHRRCRTEAAAAGDDHVDDLVDVLLKLQADRQLDFQLTDDSIKAVILAGSDTSSTTIIWVMSELVKNPRVLRQVQEEVRSVCGSKGDVDESMLPELRYLKLVIKEALRLHAPVPLLVPRQCSEDCEIDGFHIKAASYVLVNVWAIGRDPKYWKDPEKFRPERFISSSVDFKGANFEFLPFGAGRRMCPGLLLGMANVELPLAKFLYHFDWKLAGGMKPQDLDMDESFGGTSTRKNDLKLIPIPYHQSNFANLN